MASLHGQHFDAVVIGAGMSGLAAGIRLALGGKSVIILERHEAPGGLNSFYTLGGRKYDVGLHAMTNYAAPGEKGVPLTKLLRQLRIKHADFDLAEQKGSRIAFPGVDLRFSNDFALLESEVARAFPPQIDGFRKLADFCRTLNATDLAAGEQSAGPVVAEYITDPLLRDMLACPIYYYGSAREGDIDLGQYAIMFKSLFFEGFARPYAGVRQIIRVLTRKYAQLGGVRKMRLGVSKIRTDGRRASALDLDNGETITADHVLSSIGRVETQRIIDGSPGESEDRHVGRLSFVETISVLDTEPADIGWDDTIVFFSTTERFRYARPDDGELVDPTSGVICMPNNYRYPEGKRLPNGLLRVTAQAHYDNWCSLEEPAYQAAKRDWYRTLTEQAVGLLPPLPDGHPGLEAMTEATDMFTPRTITKFTGHVAGAIYGSPNKVKDGRTGLDNVYLIGTDQGFLGIVGAMLSGISMANLHVLQKDG
ncbi:MAG: phytoene desaturase family protein [Opitutales bacterium]